MVTAVLSRLGNLLGVIGMALVLLAAFVAQFVLKELPCPLCELQRVAFVMCGFGFLLNVRFGARAAHYGLILVGALYGAAASGRQVLLHIAPGSGEYGAPIFGMHYYSWAFVLFVAVLAGVCVLLLLGESGRLENERRGASFSAPDKFAAYLLIAMTLANAVMNVVQCGFGECADNPTVYWLLKFF